MSLGKLWGNEAKTHCLLPSLKWKARRKNKWFTEKPSATGGMVRPPIQFINPEYGLFPLSPLPRESNLDVHVCVSDNNVHTTDSYLLPHEPPWSTTMVRQPRTARWHWYIQSILVQCLGHVNTDCLHYHQCPSTTRCFTSNLLQVTAKALMFQIICFSQKMVFFLRYPYTGIMLLI